MVTSGFSRPGGAAVDVSALVGVEGGDALGQARERVSEEVALDELRAGVAEVERVAQAGEGAVLVGREADVGHERPPAQAVGGGQRGIASSRGWQIRQERNRMAGTLARAF
jgi:hypothetical protein